MQKFEYLFIRALGEVVKMPGPNGPLMPVQEFLNLRGEEGWELTACVPLPGQPANALYMKRPKD